MGHKILCSIYVEKSQVSNYSSAVFQKQVFHFKFVAHMYLYLWGLLPSLKTLQMATYYYANFCYWMLLRMSYIVYV